MKVVVVAVVVVLLLLPLLLLLLLLLLLHLAQADGQLQDQSGLIPIVCEQTNIQIHLWASLFDTFL